MNICIVGGGHIGTTLACYIKYMDGAHRVALYTRRPELFHPTLKCNDIENHLSYEVTLDVISKGPSVAAGNADIVFIALPHFAVEQAFKEIAPYVAQDAFIGVIPGGGGCEFFYEKYFRNSQTLFGFQRVPFTAKLVEYGRETNLKSWKKFSVVGTLQRERVEAACNKINLCALKTRKADNYLSIALTPTNPVLHTSRMYEIFGNFKRDHIFAEKSLFYVGWSDAASRILWSMDSELHQILNCIPEIDTSAIRPLSEHYEAPTICEMTRKINSIPTFQSVYAPMKSVDESNNAFVADTESRMFTEDFPWGLAIIRAYCDFYDVQAPTMDKVLKWYADYMGYEWYIGDKFMGKDLIKTGIPQRYGITKKQELLRCYLK